MVTLLRQNLIINEFPFSLSDKQQVINDKISLNQALDQKNNIKMTELKIGTESEVLESQARYRFGLIKDGETYHQITPQNP